MCSLKLTIGMTSKVLLAVRSDVKLSVVESSRCRVDVFGSWSRDVGKSSCATRIPRPTLGGRDVAELADLIHDVDLDGDGSEDSMSSWRKRGKRQSRGRRRNERGDYDSLLP